MTIDETSVADHYGDGGLLKRILTGLKASGVDIDNLTPDDLKAVEEFHIGGRDATVYATQKMAIKSGHHVLDIGCGIGGAARYIQSHFGCRVTGIDLTPEYIDTARALNQLTGDWDRLQFEIASALDLPLEPVTFDACVTMHVAMNIEDRAGLYTEIARVMKPEAIFAVYDVMKKGDEPVRYPVPWADTPETSHLTTPDEMKELLGEAGFEVLEVEDRTQFGLEFFNKPKGGASGAASGGALGTEPQAPAIHVIMGESGPQKLNNVRANIEHGCIAPVQIIARRMW